MKKAWIENNKVRDIANGNPAELFHPDIAVHYDTDVPDDAMNGAELINGVWVNPIVTAVEIAVIPPKLSPIEFKMLFTSQERIAITALKSTDAIIGDAFMILDDPRLTEVDLSLASNIDLIDYLATVVPILTPARVAEIKACKIL